MKTHQLEKTLRMLIEEDTEEYQVTVDLLNAMQDEIRIKENTMNLYKAKENRLMYLNNIKESKFATFLMNLRLLVIPLPLILLFVAPILSIVNETAAICTFASILIAVMASIIENHRLMKDINYDEDVIKNYAYTVNMLHKSKKSLRREYISIRSDVCIMEDEIQELNKEMIKLVDRKDSLGDELSYLEGNLIGIDKLLGKFNIEEISNDLEIVEYISEKQRKLEK